MRFSQGNTNLGFKLKREIIIIIILEHFKWCHNFNNLGRILEVFRWPHLIEPAGLLKFLFEAWQLRQLHIKTAPQVQQGLQLGGIRHLIGQRGLGSLVEFLHFLKQLLRENEECNRCFSRNTTVKRGQECCILGYLLLLVVPGWWYRVACRADPQRL